MSTKYLIPSTLLALSEFGLRDRWEVWRAFNKGVFQLQRNDLPRDGIYASARSYRLGETILGEYSLSGNYIRRTLSGHAVEREELLVLRMHRSGFTKGTMNGQDFEMNSAWLTLFDFHQPIHADTEHVDYVSFLVPYSSVGYDPSVHPRFLQIPVSTPIGRVLQSNLELMSELIPDASVRQARALSDGLCALLRALVIKDLRCETVQKRLVQSREVAVRRYIEANLRNPSLGVDDICKSVGLSRTALYRIFDKQGGVRRAIIKLRLKRIEKELATSEPIRGLVGRVARHWGFRDQAHFTKLFRRTTGIVPSDVIGTGLVLSPDPKMLKPTGAPEKPSLIKPLIELYRQPRNA